MQKHLRRIHIVNFIFLFFIALTTGFSQTSVNNPGFEDEPADATTPMGWLACEPGTTPDIFPGVYGNYKESSEGETYVGIITRQDGSNESIGQRLSSKLKKATCYSFQLDLSRIEDYVGYNESLKLRIWLGNKKCSKDQMVYESDFIENEDWETHTVQFSTIKNAKYIILEAYHPELGIKGHILIDNMSEIATCSKA